jgi:hypothetical protein
MERTSSASGRGCGADSFQRLVEIIQFTPKGLPVAPTKLVECAGSGRALRLSYRLRPVAGAAGRPLAIPAFGNCIPQALAHRADVRLARATQYNYEVAGQSLMNDGRQEGCVRIWRSVLCVAAVGFWAAGSAYAATVTFDLDTGTPTLFTGQSIPFDQTVDGLVAHFSSPQGAAFSIQTDSSTQFKLSQFSGHYLYDNNLDRNVLDIAFSQQLASIAFTFATADFQQVEVPTTIQLTAFRDVTGTQPVGSATAHATYGGDTMPMGTLSFNSGAQPFNVVELVLPFQPQGATDFLVDSITVTTTDVAPSTPTETATPTPTPTGTPIRACIGNCNGDGSVTVNEIISLVNIALGSARPSDCSHGIPLGASVDIAFLVRAVANALSGCPSS